METTARTKKRTLLSSMEDVITKAKEFSITPELYEAAAESLEHLSIVLQLTKDEAMLLSFFFEMCSSSRIWMSKESIVPCEDRNKKSQVGTISYIPAVFGCVCAQAAIQHLIGDFDAE